jgi:KUP system potassium uptake protein
MTIVRTDAQGMSRWRKRLFVATSYAADSPAEFFKLPSDRIVTLGSHIELKRGVDRGDPPPTDASRP